MVRTTKIAAAGALGGLLIALTVGLALRDDRRAEMVIAPTEKSRVDPPERDLRRCRTITVTDAGRC